MLFSDHPRTLYGKSPAHEVICQFRFPPILTINQNEPADFQEAVREHFPQYVKRLDTPAPQIVGLGGPNPQIKQQPPIANYNLLSADGRWKLNLTQNFISLSTLHYTGWQDFARQLDKPLAEFIALYKPSYFERVGLRYVNIFSREKLSLNDYQWSELFTPAYLGALKEPDVREEDFFNCSTDLLFKLDSSCQAKIHAGPGRLKNNRPNAQQDPEVKFILDMDLSMAGGQLPCTLSAGALETLHAHATKLFEGAITDTLRTAMDPQ